MAAADGIDAVVAANARAEAARVGLSGREIAARLGWSSRTTARRLSGEIPFEVGELVCLAELLNIPITQLLPAPTAARSELLAAVSA